MDKHALEAQLDILPEPLAVAAKVGRDADVAAEIVGAHQLAERVELAGHAQLAEHLALEDIVAPLLVGAAQGLGFAVPGNTARWVTGELITHGRVQRAFLGIAAATVELQRRLARELDVLNERGVEVQSVTSGGPADRAGILAGDLIIALEGRIVSGVDDLHRLLSKNANAARGSPSRGST